MPGSLVAAWSFDAAPCVDHTGHGYDITPTGNTVVASGGAHGSALTQVTSSEVFTAFTLPPAFETPQRTWMASVKFSGSLVDLGWVGEFYRQTSDTGVWGLLMLNGGLQFRCKDTSNTVHKVDLATPTVFKTITATYDGTNLSVYTDSSLIGQVASPNIWTATHFRPMDFSSGGVTTKVDDMRLFDGALTAEEIDAWRVLPADQMPAEGGRLKYESAPGIWTPVPLKTATGDPLIVKSETSPGTWEALP
jgi:hypothetical protein